ncbi:MAG: murein L,D-transpeptidase catalytic domain family protein [Bacteroidetes bacterium]|nr:murein L,D-transpeptidase catalytic domain family protein [Bacteroidota bacterium]
MRILIVSLVLLLIILTGCEKSTRESSNQTSYLPDEEITIRALDFCKSNGMNQDFCILIDMGIHSGKKRFFVWDFNRKEITHQFLVGHGCCENPWGKDYSKDNAGFSNVNNSHCSSLGKYKIDQRGYSNWGVHTKYLLHGLESSNDNALKRIIVLHSWEAVSDQEVYPNGTPEGWGCPVLSNSSFVIIDPLLKTASKPVLMWIYSSK